MKVQLMAMSRDAAVENNIKETTTNGKNRNKKEIKKMNFGFFNK